MQDKDYNKTMNLPSTEFPMRAGLPQREPAMLAEWENNRLYDRLMEKNEGKPIWVLHDGPPYANGDIHIGTAMNKIIKDIIVRYRNMSGYKSPYVPGWDTHGLPIELKARSKAGVENAAHMAPEKLRAVCREFALGYVDDQRDQFKRLGVLGDWDNPYLTLSPEFEARQIEVFGEMAMKGYIYKGLKPVHWCPECETALAEAEIEYTEDPCYSVYVKFAVNDDKGLLKKAGIDPKHTYFVIWTTTIWTLPANTAICLGPDFIYNVVECDGEYYIIAESLYEEVMAAAGKTDYMVVASFKGSELENMKAQHPFIDRQSHIIIGDHVTLESGTGCVHTAPGHGVDDFNICKNYPEIPVIVPVDNRGKMTEEASPECAGMSTDDANKALAKHMESIGCLFATKKIVHQYPHCWRCKEPVLFRATEQWFCSVESFKEQAVEAIKGVKWIPSWGEERITSMVRERSDWCISRQRLWGVPIPIFYCEDCGKPIIERSFINSVSELFRREGSDGWYTHSAEQILPEGATCPHCGGKHFRKEKDIMDVWFDSGSSHAAVLDIRPNLKWPADLYLEGGDQHRGWFQSSLLTAVAWRGEAPYKAVLTHGWTVDGEGRKMSKSLGNVIKPDQVVNEYGADILRLWVASIDYRVDVRLSNNILKQLSEAYRKIRNTARFILSNLNDFNPDNDSVTDDKLEEIDRWAMMRLDDLTEQVNEAYNAYEFHDAFHKIHNFCVVDLSNFYLDVLKDRLYVEKAQSLTRKAAQTVIFRLLNTLTKMLAPILAFTAEEIWAFMPHGKGEDAESVMFNEIPKPGFFKQDADYISKWEKIHALRDDVKKALEPARNEKIIGSSLDASITLYCSGELLEFVKSVSDLLPSVLIVSQVKIKEGDGGDFEGDIEGLKILVSHADGDKCARCWTYSQTVGQSAHGDLCSRCASIVG
ncbi:MAG: isoleucine--tRNA ligase [Oscillospiraceae bacterium]|nr:isoleucine--tRNA ligase [Oscillospiraceae bacterium]MDD4412927.1 isoleucine--tRNA ligase [Oscillospiraceae bacterium]